MRRLDLEELGLDRGGALLIERLLRPLPVGARLGVSGASPALAVHLQGWCRARGHGYEPGPGGGTVIRGVAAGARARGAEQTGRTKLAEPEALVEQAPARWGLAARGAFVEAGSPPLHFALDQRAQIWADDAPRLYAQAAAAQWDPETAIDWGADFELPEEVEDAVVQVMTYLIENETAALIVPARFLGQIHPHFREIQQVLAIQVADEARHIEVFTRRAGLRRDALGLSTSGGQASLKTLLEEPDFALASFLLSVLGEGSFLQLLWFLHEHGPDPVTRQIMKLAAQDESRHVAFGLAHLERHATLDPGLRPRLRAAIERRHEALAETTGLNEDVFSALVLIAAGSWRPADIERGYRRVEQLKEDMDHARRQYLTRLGFSEAESAELSSLHTRNFM